MASTAFIVYFFVVSIVPLIVLCKLLKYEHKNRDKVPLDLLPSNLRYLSILPLYLGVCTIVSSQLSAIGGAINNLDFCGISGQLTQILFFASAITISLFQLSRLKFCFNKTNVNQQYAYPDALFLILQIILIVLLIFLTLSVLIFQKWEYNAVTGTFLVQYFIKNKYMHPKQIH